jgi:hypothetical protein
MNTYFVPYFCRIEKSIGSKYAQEIYQVDLPKMELHYTFQNALGSQEFRRNIGARHHLTSPAISTSGLFALTRKFDATERTSITLISSPNNWSYQGPPIDKTIYAELKSHELSDFQLNGNSLSAGHMCLYEFDSSLARSETPVEMFLSKHFSIPYKLVHGDQMMVIKNLKKHKN